MRPEERDELLAAYALGSLSGPDAAAVEDLVRADPGAARQLAAYHEIVDLVALDVPLRRADPELRRRVLRAAKRMDRPRRRVPVFQTLAAAALIGAVVVAVGWAANLQRELDDLEQSTAALQAVVSADARRLDALDSEQVAGGDKALRQSLQQVVDTQQRIVAILADPEVQSSALTGTAAGHGATGHYLWSASLGEGVLIVQELPPLPLGTVYQIWLDDGFETVSAGTFVPSPDGSTQILVGVDSPFEPRSIALAPAPIGGATSLEPPIVLDGLVER